MKGDRQSLASLQYLRAVGALAVVISHSEGLVVGQAGVDVFFVMSGFIIWVTAKRDQSAFAFMVNRVMRVAPLYWLATTIMALHQHAGLLAFAQSVSFVPFYGEEQQIWPVLVQGWTLNYEMFFYVLIALTLFLRLPSRLSAILTTLICLCILGFLNSSNNPIVETYTSSLLLEFCFGIGLAHLWLSDRLARPVFLVPLAVCGIVASWSCHLSVLPTTYRFLVWGCPSTLLVAAALSLEGSALMPRIRPLLILGDASYAIYLFHPFFLKTVILAVNSSMPAVNSAAVVAVSAAGGILIRRYVEKPLLSFLRARLISRTAAISS